MQNSTFIKENKMRKLFLKLYSDFKWHGYSCAMLKNVILTQLSLKCAKFYHKL